MGMHLEGELLSMSSASGGDWVLVGGGGGMDLEVM